MIPNTTKAAHSASSVSPNNEASPSHNVSHTAPESAPVDISTDQQAQHSPIEKSVEHGDNFDPITGEIIEHHDNQRSLFDLPSKELDQLTQLKRGASKVAISLAHSPEAEQVNTAAKVASCAQRLRLKSGRWIALNRCKSRVCPHCANVTSSKMTARIKSAMGFLGFAMKDEAHRDTAPHRLAIGLKVTLNTGESCELSELNERLSILHDCFPRLSRIAALKDQLIGYVRSTEIVQSSSADEPRAHPHIHALLLLRADSDIEKIAGAIVRYWIKKMRTEHNKLGKPTNAVASVKRSDIEELRSHSVSDLLSWCRYATKGSYDLIGLSTHSESQREAIQATDPAYWSKVEAATRRVRLISFGGELRRATAEAQAEHIRASRAKRRIEAVGPITETVRGDDQVYSVALSRYVKASEHERWIEDAALSSRMSYAHPAPHFASIFQREYIASMERAEAAHKLKLLLLLGAPQTPLKPSSKLTSGELSHISTRKVKADYHEADEIEREPPQNGSPSTHSGHSKPSHSETNR